jgi:HTH-type transcriptional regulator / antitoxin HigA
MLKINGLIKTEEQYEIALERVYDLMQLDLKEGTRELNEAELLGVLIEQYEKVHYPIALPHENEHFLSKNTEGVV